MCISFFISGFTFRVPSFFTPKNEHKYLNKSIIDTDLSKYIKTFQDSTYLIFIFSYSCPHCLNSIENLRQYSKSKTVDRIFTLATGDKNTKLYFDQNFHPDFYIKDLSFDAINKITDALPTAFFIKHDTIRVVIQSALPSPYIFRKQYNFSKYN